MNTLTRKKIPSQIAIIADIHANLEALTAVMTDISRQNVQQIYCLGDVVGYGPNPCECLDIAMTFSICLMGDHDKLALEGESENPIAQRLILWTRRQLSTVSQDCNDADRRRHFLRTLPLTHTENGTMFLHGSPRDPLNEYLFPELVFDSSRLDDIFSLVNHCCFIGHTHMPGIFTPDGEFFTPEQIDGVWRIKVGTKMMCNVGSVGQPRDSDCRACYCLYDGDRITFRRVDYDFDSTIRKINDLFPPQ